MHLSTYINFHLDYTISSASLKWDSSKKATIGCGTLAWTQKELEVMLINVMWQKFERELVAHAEVTA